MPTYNVHAINIGSFLLGEADKVITVFSAERGLLRCVAKSARKPGTKMTGRSDVLSVNKLLLSSGRSFEIITQAECIDTFPEFRKDLQRMSYGMYYAELSHHFGPAFSEESQLYYDYLYASLGLQARSKSDPEWLCLEFELGLLGMLGYRPELTFCMSCRDVLADYNIGTFNQDMGGVMCQQCSVRERQLALREGVAQNEFVRETSFRESTHITPLVWKNLVLACDHRVSEEGFEENSVVKLPLPQSIRAARRLIHSYIEHRAGRHMKALDLLEQLNAQ